MDEETRTSAASISSSSTKSKSEIVANNPQAMSIQERIEKMERVLTACGQVFLLSEQSKWSALSSQPALVHVIRDGVDGCYRILCHSGQQNILPFMRITPKWKLSRASTKFITIALENGTYGVGFTRARDAQEFLNQLQWLHGVMVEETSIGSDSEQNFGMNTPVMKVLTALSTGPMMFERNESQMRMMPGMRDLVKIDPISIVEDTVDRDRASPTSTAIPLSPRRSIGIPSVPSSPVKSCHIHPIGTERTPIKRETIPPIPNHPYNYNRSHEIHENKWNGNQFGGNNNRMVNNQNSYVPPRSYLNTVPPPVPVQSHSFGRNPVQRLNSDNVHRNYGSYNRGVRTDEHAHKNWNHSIRGTHERSVAAFLDSTFVGGNYEDTLDTHCSPSLSMEDNHHNPPHSSWFSTNNNKSSPIVQSPHNYYTSSEIFEQAPIARSTPQNSVHQFYMDHLHNSDREIAPFVPGMSAHGTTNGHHLSGNNGTVNGGNNQGGGYYKQPVLFSPSTFTPSPTGQQMMQFAFPPPSLEQFHNYRNGDNSDECEENTNSVFDVTLTNNNKVCSENREVKEEQQPLPSLDDLINAFKPLGYDNSVIHSPKKRKSV